MLLSINPDNPQPRLIKQVVDELKRGAVICYPTDTVYGIGCDIFNPKAVKRIYQIKKRPSKKPFSFMCSSLKNVSTYCYVSNTAYRLIKKHLPGPYTFVMPAFKLVPKIMITKQKTVGIRVPEHAICRDLVEKLGNPILTTSAIQANGNPPMTEAYEIDEMLGKQVDIVIDGGPVYPSPSSVISLVDDVPVILREGKGDISGF
ncbi:MAG: threonylcarbamoyl-AMP synthase [Desulfobulbaceae bacterium]|nr:threonylcarbamoyl-AMP synthase [Desulfobulbaceae bacterium]MCK5437299.1 threonylcarbamoyl-AMP synthase [Desulfobulbaceae bacterium]MCK5545518.1 threonylcarbamoyl-AMP synthase [Desulfobulbaceae bacterium]